MSERPIINNVNEKITAWLDKNRDAFGRKILCAGIDLRIAVHLSHLFPESSIVYLTDQEADLSDKDLRGPLVIRDRIETYQGGLFDTVV